MHSPVEGWTWCMVVVGRRGRPFGESTPMAEQARQAAALLGIWMVPTVPMTFPPV